MASTQTIQSKLMGDRSEAPSIEYLAGFFDGEGCFYADHNQRIPTFRVQMCTTKQTEPKMFHDRFGGSLRDQPGQEKTHSHTYYWDIHGAKALFAAEEMNEHLRGKRDQSQAFIKAIRKKLEFRTGEDRHKMYTEKQAKELKNLAKEVNSYGANRGGRLR